MIFLVFQFLDLLTAFVLIGTEMGLVSNQILFYHASYLIGKAIWFFKDPFSWIDGIIGLYLISMIFGVRSFFSYVFAAYFVYKFVMYWILKP